MKSSKGICDERGCESPARNEKGPARGLFPQHGDLHNIFIIVNCWKSVLWLQKENWGAFSKASLVKSYVGVDAYIDPSDLQ